MDLIRLLLDDPQAVVPEHRIAAFFASTNPMRYESTDRFAVMLLHFLGRAQMHSERRAQRYHFDATAEAVGSSDVRAADVENLSLIGAYLAMPDPFNKGASILVKIHSKAEFFQSAARVAYSSQGEGMGVEFVNLAPPFRIVLQEWLWNAVPQG